MKKLRNRAWRSDGQLKLRVAPGHEPEVLRGLGLEKKKEIDDDEAVGGAEGASDVFIREEGRGVGSSEGEGGADMDAELRRLSAEGLIHVEEMEELDQNVTTADALANAAASASASASAAGGTGGGVGGKEN